MSIALSLRSCASIAAAVTASVVCGSLMSASASIDSGDRSVYVPITPCRVMDTRPAPDNVGARTTPLAAQETHTISVLGANGQCTIPLDASGVAMNVTAVNPTDASYLTIFPADATKPLASSVNWVAMQGATPNSVTSDVSVDGKVSFFNNAGNVDVIADVVGYFVDHNHDDRYYTEAEIDAKLAAKADKADGSRTIVLGPSAFIPADSATIYSIDPSSLFVLAPGGSQCFGAPIDIPAGATVTALRLDGLDSAAADFGLFMYADPFGIASATTMASTITTGTPGEVTTADITIATPIIETSTRAYSVRLCTGAGLFFYSARIDYTLP
jgi:hypothetical protein